MDLKACLNSKVFVDRNSNPQFMTRAWIIQSNSSVFVSNCSDWALFAWYVSVPFKFSSFHVFMFDMCRCLLSIHLFMFSCLIYMCRCLFGSYLFMVWALILIDILRKIWGWHEGSVYSWVKILVVDVGYGRCFRKCSLKHVVLLSNLPVQEEHL